MARPPLTGSRIRERRLAQGLRQSALAREAGISASYLNLIEHNRRAIGGALLGRLAEALGCPVAQLSEDEGGALADALRASGAAQGLPEPALDAAAEIARRHPDWARAAVVQAETLSERARTIEALTDRLTHDPALASALHELLSAVSVVRSTASILAGTPEIDPNWLRRFHGILDADSRRLAQGAEAVVGYFDRAAPGGQAALLPAEAATRVLDDLGAEARAEIETRGVDAVPGIVACLTDGRAAALVEAQLRQDARDAARLPAALVDAAEGPEDLIEAADGDLALVLRRLGLRGEGRGLLICDAAGALLRRRAVAGFPLPVVGAGCPLWPVYAALSRPGVPLRMRIETPDGARWLAHAVAQGKATGWDAPPVQRATMLLVRDDGGAGPAHPVGPGCRTCPRDGCPARREPSVLASG